MDQKRIDLFSRTIDMVHSGLSVLGALARGGPVPEGVGNGLIPVSDSVSGKPRRRLKAGPRVLSANGAGKPKRRQKTDPDLRGGVLTFVKSRKANGVSRAEVAKAMKLDPVRAGTILSSLRDEKAIGMKGKRRMARYFAK